MQSIQNKWFKRVFLSTTFDSKHCFLIVLLIFVTMACKKERIERIHIKGRIVTKGTGDPILMAGVKFGIYEAQEITGILSPQDHLLIDSFETDANGMFEHTFKNPGFIENMSVKQISVIPGYAEHSYRYRLTNDAQQFEKIEQTKRIVFAFSIDNRNGSPFDHFTYAVPGSQITSFVGNVLTTQYYQTISYTPLRMLIADHQLDTQYNIDVLFETLDTAYYTFVP